MSEIFKNCGHFLKLPLVIHDTLSILLICTNLTKKKCLGQQLGVTRVRIKTFNLNLLLIANKKRHYEMLTLQ